MFNLYGETWKEDLAALHAAQASSPSGSIPGAANPGSGALSDSDSALAHETAADEEREEVVSQAILVHRSLTQNGALSPGSGSHSSVAAGIGQAR